MLSDMTKGPWHVVAYGDGDSLVICEDEAGEKRIAFMAVPGARFEDERRKTWTRIKANAQAIAALPELIEVLDEAYGELLGDGVRDGARCLLLTKIEAALRKAGVPQ